VFSYFSLGSVKVEWRTCKEKSVLELSAWD